MRELAKSAARYTWAMSIFGVQQAANVLTLSNGRQPRKANAALYSVTQAAENEFEDLVFAAYQVGDEVQRGLTEIVFDTVTLQAFNPGYISMLTSAVVEQSQDSFQTFS